MGRIKNYFIGALALAALFVVAPLQAPIVKVSTPSPIERILADRTFEKIVKESERKFFKKIYPEFPYTHEISKIIEHSRIFGLEPELMMAVRLSENGRDDRAYGVLPTGDLLEEYQGEIGYMRDGKFYLYENLVEKQLHWSAQTISYYMKKFQSQKKEKDLFAYIAARYSPPDPSNPLDTNKYWRRNVERYYNLIKSSEPTLPSEPTLQGEYKTSQISRDSSWTEYKPDMVSRSHDSKAKPQSGLLKKLIDARKKMGLSI